MAMVSVTERGTVKMFNAERGFGFIAADAGGKDIFVHARDLHATGIMSLAEGDLVSFERTATERGDRAVNVRRE